MLYRRLIIIAAIALGLNSCSNDNSASLKNEIDKSIDTLKEKESFDKADNVFEYSLDTLKDSKLVLNIKSTDVELAKKAVKIAKKHKIESNVTSLPEVELKGTPFAVVNTSVANMRVRPSRSSGMATQVTMGMKLELIDHKGKWYRVKTPQGYIAWIVKSSFTLLTKEESDKLSALPKAMVIVSSTYAYNSENKSRVESDLVYGNVVVLNSKGKEWSSITLPGDRELVVKTSDIVELDKWQQNARFDEEKLLRTAYDYMGQPYLWGGNSFKGIDCSGYSAAIYYSMGILLPRDAYQQATQGDHIDYKLGEKDGFKNLKIGDLLFFGGKRVTHVAIWLGNNEYTHNSSTYGRVYVSSVDPEAKNYNQNLVDIILDVRRINGTKNLDRIIDLNSNNIWL